MSLLVIQDFKRESSLIKHLKCQIYDQTCGQVFVSGANEVKHAFRDGLVVI